MYFYSYIFIYTQFHVRSNCPRVSIFFEEGKRVRDCHQEGASFVEEDLGVTNRGVVYTLCLLRKHALLMEKMYEDVVEIST